MAIKKTREEYIPYTEEWVCEFVCDSEEDVKTLPEKCAPGSIAMVATSGLPMYMVNASGKWVKV